MSRGKVLPLEKVFELVEQLKLEGKRVVFTNGCFDLVHPGHTHYLREASDLGDVLIVAVNSDRTVRALKGPARPLFPQEERAEVLAALECVTYVTIFDELTPRAIIKRLRPHILVKGSDWKFTEIVGREEVEAAGGKVFSLPILPNYSTSSIIQSILNNPANEPAARPAG